jgi:transcriptional regulator with XRE-family HTH domain
MALWAETALNRLGQLNLTQGQLAEHLGVTRPAIAHYLHGRREPSLDQLQRIAKFLDIGLAEFIEGKSTENTVLNLEEHHVFIPYVDKQNPLEPTAQEDLRYMREFSVQKAWITDRNLKVTDLVAVKVEGSSMEPSLQDGDIVIADTSDNALKEDEVYVLYYDERIAVKRLKQRYDGALILHNDNPNPVFVDMIVPKHDRHSIHIIGRKVWRTG